MAIDFPVMSDVRPHTAHSKSYPSWHDFIAEEDEQSDDAEQQTPRASIAGLTAPSDLSRRRLSRDDTANDFHINLREANGLPLPSLSPHSLPIAGNFTAATSEHWRLRPSLSRMSSNTLSIASDPSGVNASEARNPVRRFSTRRCREKVRESVSRVVAPNRTRRASASVHNTMRNGEGTIDPALLSKTHQPSSPTKRSAAQSDGRASKIQSRLPGFGDRKDTPAPSSAMPLRPASSSQHAPPVMPAVGGENARKAAAWQNTYMSPNTSNWPTLAEAHLDIHSRRLRVGSLSSAADSGADLTLDSVSMSEHDLDGDIIMAGGDDEPTVDRKIDFTRLLPNELSLSIFRFLDGTDLARAEAVNTTWKSLVQDPSVWRTAFMRKYGRQVYSDPPPIQVGGVGVGRPNKPDQEWCRMYKARVQLEKNWRAGANAAGKAVYLSGHTDSVYCLQFDEEKIITGSRDRTIRVWDINTYQCLKVIGGPGVRPQLGPKVLRTVDYPSFHMATASVNGTAYGDSIYHVPEQWHDASILCLQYDEEILVTGSSDSDLLIWDIKTYEPIKRLRKHTGGVLDVALDAKHIVSCSKDSRIIVWDRETLEPKGDLTGHRGPVNAVQLRGHLLVSASGDGIARLWDLNQMKLIKEFSAKERGLAAVEFSEDMEHVLAGGNDNITYKFERESGREVMQFAGHTQLVRSLWLDSANNRVVSGSYDLDLRVYDFVTGQELWRGEEWTTSWMLAAKSDYRRIVATSQDGRILIVDFGIHKGAPSWESGDGNPIDGIDLLRGTEHTTAILFRNPWTADANKLASRGLL